MEVTTNFDSDRAEYEYMKDQIEKQAIEEMAKTIGRARGYGCRDKDSCESCIAGRLGCMAHEVAQILYSEDYRKQSEGEWIFEHEYYGKMLCTNCKGEALVNECSEYVDSDFCPNCGAKMKGGAE